MITGFNTDIDSNGRVFHVQTEDRGFDNPIVETLVYSGGEIVTSRKSSYAELIRSETYTEAEVLRRMEAQHTELIREVRSGRFETDEPKPFGHSIVTNRSFDEVVAEFLEDQVAPDPIRLALDGPEVFVEGARTTVELRVVEGAPERPVRGAAVVVRLVATGRPSRELFTGATDARGRVEGAFEIPVLPGANAAIVCQATSSGRAAELKRLVKKTVPSA